MSSSSARRFLKRKLGDEASLVAAKPKGMKVGGLTAHHNRCRLAEARFWKSKDQDFIDGIWMADESKITFREHKNRSIDIVWVYRGDAGKSNWYEQQRWPGQINLFLLQSRNGIELYGLYDKNLNMKVYY